MQENINVLGKDNTVLGLSFLACSDPALSLTET